MRCLALLPLILTLVLGAERTPREILDEIRSKGNDVPSAVFEELAQQKSPEALDALIEGLDAVGNVNKVCAAYAAFAHFRGVPEVEDRASAYLAECARSSKEKLALHAVWQLGFLWPAAQEDLFELALDHATADGRSTALLPLVEHGMPLEPRQLDRLARSKDPAVCYEGVLARTARIEDEGKRAKVLARLLKSRDSIDRLVAVELLVNQPSPKRFDALRAALGDEKPPVQRKALASLERTRTKMAIGILIERLAEAGRGESFRISSALERLTNMSLGTEAGRWQRWWAAEGDRFEFTDAPSEKPQKEGEPHATASFYGLPIHAERLVFAIDTSDSMKQPAKEGGATRLAIAKRELTGAIQGLPETSEFDVVNFGKSAWHWQGELVPAKTRHKLAAQRHVQYLELSWGTEIYRALREAYRDPRADTILFLTDGDPQLTLMRDRVALRRMVGQWNRTRHTTIDCITIGTDRPWLRKLSELTGGRYKRID